MESDAARMCELLIGLPDITVLGIDDEPGPLVVHVESSGLVRACLGCREPGRVHARAKVTLVDLPACRILADARG